MEMTRGFCNKSTPSTVIFPVLPHIPSSPFLLSVLLIGAHCHMQYSMCRRFILFFFGCLFDVCIAYSALFHI
ncbi:hypothetical protein GDO81_008562 [Engystomops pustulosus]|uniref:Uncharacterized protein n=1 Tax=Engystomops pustulosus TaxID=76066 RepID=A0AAV7CHL6_ENGPU|nr:hypothetical protein GDO81_008562 [Engystomops pustulosus]